MKSLIRKLLTLLSLALLLNTTGCGPTMALYDQYAYTQTTSIKVDALNLMNLATENYSNHEKEVTNLTTEIQKIQEYDRGRQNNSLTVQQWEILMNDSTGHLLGYFLNQWKNSGTLGQAFINGEKTNVSNTFNSIIKLEINKNKPK